MSVDNPGASITAGTAAPLTITTLNPHLKPPEAWNWNVTFERQLPLNSVLSLAYVAHRGLHGWTVYDINQPQAGTVVSGVNANFVRPYKGFAAIQEEESVVNSMYNSLQLSWNRRMSKGSSFSLSYTLSKSSDGGSNYRDIVPYTYNTSNLYGPSEYDTRHIAVITYLYELPFFKDQHRLAGKVLGGWQLSGTAQFQTGVPCGVGTNNDFAGLGEYGSFGCGATPRKASSGSRTERPQSTEVLRGRSLVPAPHRTSRRSIPTVRLYLPSPVLTPSTFNPVCVTRSMAQASRIGISLYISASP